MTRAFANVDLAHGENMPCPRRRRSRLAAGFLQLVDEKRAGSGFQATVRRVYQCHACNWVSETVEKHVAGHQGSKVLSS